MEQMMDKNKYGFCHNPERGLVTLYNDTILVKRDRPNTDLQAFDTWVIFNNTNSVLIGRFDFFRDVRQDEPGESCWYITARIECNGTVYETDYLCAKGPFPPVEETYVVAATDHLLSIKDNGYNATGKGNLDITITINDIVRLANGDRRIKIGIVPAETIFGPKPPSPFIKTMILTESGSFHIGYQFTVEQVNQFKCLHRLDIPAMYQVRDEASLTCALNCVVATVSKLLKEKHPDIFELLGY